MKNLPLFNSSFLRIAGLVVLSVSAYPSQAKLSARSYVLDGLIAHWDGIENVSYGGDHDNAATNWTDLTGNGVDVKVPQGASFVDNALKTVRSYGSKLSTASLNKLYAPYSKARYTIDFTYDKSTAPAEKCMMMYIAWNQQWLGILNSTKIGFTPNKSGDNYSLAGSVAVSSVLGFHSFSSRQHETKWSVIIDGGLFSNEGTIAIGSPNYYEGHGLTFNRGYDQGGGLNGQYYAMRFYDRPLSDDEIKVNHAVDAVRFKGVNPLDIALPSGWKFVVEDEDVSLFKNLKIRAKGASGDSGYGVGGTIRINDGEEVSEGSVWCEHNTPISIRLMATPQQGYEFVGWAGVPVDAQGNAEINVEIDDHVEAIFRKIDRSDMREYTWVGSKGGLWSDSSNWQESDGAGGFPQANDTIKIPFEAVVTLTASTPRLGSALVEGTLVMTNWTTCLSASTVTILNKGKITCGAAATNQTDLSRVWINCTDLTIEKGGAIDVNYKGYAGRSKKGNYNGYGPGRGFVESPNYNVAPSHGGHGARLANSSFGLPNTMPYDNPIAPELPGSSGSASAYAIGLNGGGAVKIEAFGAVMVNGSIKADGQNAYSYGTGYGDNHCPPGAGGSIFITCKTISGSGVLSAAGGGGAGRNEGAPPAGGGMIAVHYDAESQKSASVEGMTISAAAGRHFKTYFKRTNVNDGYDPDGINAGMGTVYFTDAQIAHEIAGKTLTGNVLGFSQFICDGDWHFTGGHLMFGEEGVKVRVNGNLVFSGEDSRLEIGGGVTTNWNANIVMYAGKTPNELTVTGDLTLGGVSRLDIRAAETNGVDKFGAYVKVGGTMTIATNCFVYSWSDCRNLGSPYFEVGSLYVNTGAVFSAVGRGGRGTYDWTVTSYGTSMYGKGPGAHESKTITGGSHGGIGGGSSAKYVYDDEFRPCMPGSGGSSYWNQWAEGGSGGGLIYVTATNGTICIDGRVDASGLDGTKRNGYGGGGSGGTIFFEAKRFFGSETGELLVTGGDTKPFQNGTTILSSGSGAGGRIAVWSGEPWSQGLKPSRIKASTEPIVGKERFMSYRGSYSAAPGEILGSVQGYSGEAGTVRFCHVDREGGFSLILR